MKQSVSTDYFQSSKSGEDYTASALRYRSAAYIGALCFLIGGTFGSVFALVPAIPVPESIRQPILVNWIFVTIGMVGVIFVVRKARQGILSQGSLLAGLLGVVLTFSIATLASWGAHIERHHAARSTLLHYRAMLGHEMKAAARLFERVSNRWASLNFDVRQGLVETDAQGYFRDSPALRSQLLLGRDGAHIWKRGRSPEDLFWLMERINEHGVSSWIRQIQQQHQIQSWYLPDPDQPSLAMLMVTPAHSTKASFIAVLDLKQMLEPEPSAAHHDFAIAVEHDNPGFLSGHHESHDVYERVIVTPANGPSFYLNATAGPASLMSVPGLLPFLLIVLGLVTSYQLVMGRSLIVIQRDQAKALATSVQQFMSLFVQAPEPIYAFDCSGRYVAVNPVAGEVAGLSNQDIGSVRYQDLLTTDVMSEEDFQVFDRAFSAATRGRAGRCEVRYRSSRGAVKEYEIAFVPIVVDQSITGVFGIVNDITERLRAQESQRVLQKSLESSDNAIVVVDVRESSLPVVFLNTAFTKMTGYQSAEVSGSTIRRLAGPETGQDDIEAIRKAVMSGRPETLTLKSYRKDGTPFWNQLSLAPVTDGSGSVTHFAALMTDISDKKEQESQLAYQATHDVLTGLPNRALFEDRLAHDFELALRNRQMLAVMFIDLDDFKPINDTLGHKVGDELLISVSRTLEGIVRPGPIWRR